jgi:hypothetical protein
MSLQIVFTLVHVSSDREYRNINNWIDETKSSGSSFSRDTGVHLEARCADVRKERYLSIYERLFRLLSGLPLLREVRLDAGWLQIMMMLDKSEATHCEEVHKIRPLSRNHILWATRRESGRRE